MADRHPLVTFEVEHLVRRRVVERQHVRPRQVLDVHVVAVLRPVAVHGDRITVERHRHELRDHQRRPHARAVRDPVAQDREVEPVQLVVALRDQLGGQLRRRVEVAGLLEREGRRLVERSLTVGRRAVHPHRRREDRPLHPVLAARLPHLGRRRDVRLGGPHGIGRHVVDVGERGQVEHRVTPGRRYQQPVEIVDVGRRMGDVRPVWQSHVDHDHVVTRIDEVIDHVGADEARTTSHGDRHRRNGS